MCRLRVCVQLPGLFYPRAGCVCVYNSQVYSIPVQVACVCTTPWFILSMCRLRVCVQLPGLFYPCAGCVCVYNSQVYSIPVQVACVCTTPRFILSPCRLRVCVQLPGLFYARAGCVCVYNSQESLEYLRLSLLHVLDSATTHGHRLNDLPLVIMLAYEPYTTKELNYLQENGKLLATT